MPVSVQCVQLITDKTNKDRLEETYWDTHMSIFMQFQILNHIISIFTMISRTFSQNWQAVITMQALNCSAFLYLYLAIFNNSKLKATTDVG